MALSGRLSRKNGSGVIVDVTGRGMLKSISFNLGIPYVTITIDGVTIGMSTFDIIALTSGKSAPSGSSSGRIWENASGVMGACNYYIYDNIHYNYAGGFILNLPFQNSLSVSLSGTSYAIVNYVVDI